VTELKSPGDILGLVLGKLGGVRKRGSYWVARCPAHEDKRASLSVAEGTKQPVVLRCHAGCDPLDVLGAVGLSWADLSPNGRALADDWTPAGPAVATYTYTDQDGKVLFGVCRTADKQFRQWRPDPVKPHGRAWSVRGVKLVLYRLPQVTAAVDAGETVFVVEGERDVHALEAAGVTATCNPMGAGKWRATYSKTLAGASVVIVADNDAPGVDHARKVAESLAGVAASVRVVQAQEGKDTADHLAAGYGPSDFAELNLHDAEPAPVARPTVEVARGDGPAILDDIEAAWCRYVAWGNQAQPVAATLWTAHSHAISHSRSVAHTPGHGGTTPVADIQQRPQRLAAIGLATPQGVVLVQQHGRLVSGDLAEHGGLGGLDQHPRPGGEQLGDLQHAGFAALRLR
jgi:5S rRNA maturation endonuclease (ribonuclease M5)